MSRERLSGFKQFFEIHLGEQEPDTKTIAKQVGASVETINKWRRQLDHRKTLFQQFPEFDDDGNFKGWKEIDNGKIQTTADI